MSLVREKSNELFGGAEPLKKRRGKVLKVEVRGWSWLSPRAVISANIGALKRSLNESRRNGRSGTRVEESCPQFV